MDSHRLRALGFSILLVILGMWATGAAEPPSQWVTGGITKWGNPAPKRLKGKITHDVYTPKDKSFHVAVPHPKSSYEFLYMQITEGVGSLDGRKTTYVIFGPAAFDLCAYHAVAISPRMSPPQPMPFEQKAVVLFEFMTGYHHEQTGVVYQQIFKKSMKVHGREAVYAVYERGPWEGGTIELQPNVQVLVPGPPPHIAFCLIDFGDDRYAYLVGEHQDDLAGRETDVDVTKGQWPRFETLIQSIELTP